jgi:DnaJ-class molecular chaperone
MGMITCPQCNGSGRLTPADDDDADAGTCPECGGTGMIRDPEEDEEN